MYIVFVHANDLLKYPVEIGNYQVLGTILTVASDYISENRLNSEHVIQYLPGFLGCLCIVYRSPSGGIWWRQGPRRDLFIGRRGIRNLGKNGTNIQM